MLNFCSITSVWQFIPVWQNLEKRAWCIPLDNPHCVINAWIHLSPQCGATSSIYKVYILVFGFLRHPVIIMSVHHYELCSDPAESSYAESQVCLIYPSFLFPYYRVQLERGAGGWCNIQDGIMMSPSVGQSEDTMKSLIHGGSDR